MSSYSSQNVLIKQKQQFNQQKITSTKTSDECHLYWKYHFQKNPLHLGIYANSEADKEIVN